MDERIRFGTKDELNTERERAFLALEPYERLMWFLRSFNERMVVDPMAVERKGNFILEKKKDGVQ